MSKHSKLSKKGPASTMTMNENFPVHLPSKSQRFPLVSQPVLFRQIRPPDAKVPTFSETFMNMGAGAKDTLGRDSICSHRFWWV